MMSKRLNINFDDGFKEISINGDNDRIIRWNPGDFNLLDKLYALMDWFENDLRSKIENSKIGDGSGQDDYEVGAITSLGEDVAAQIDSVFGAGTSKAAFQGANPISPTSSGTFLFENFMEAMIPLVEDSIKLDNRNKSNYVDKANRHKKASGR